MAAVRPSAASLSLSCIMLLSRQKKRHRTLLGAAYRHARRPRKPLTCPNRERAEELGGSTALLNKRSEIDAAVVRYCSGARARFAECADTRNKRQFLLDYIGKVTFLNDRVSIHGRIPFRGE